MPYSYVDPGGEAAIALPIVIGGGQAAAAAAAAPAAAAAACVAGPAIGYHVGSGLEAKFGVGAAIGNWLCPCTGRKLGFEELEPRISETEGDSSDPNANVPPPLLVAHRHMLRHLIQARFLAGYVFFQEL